MTTQKNPSPFRGAVKSVVVCNGDGNGNARSSSPATVLAIAALFISLAGTATAAGYVITSSNQIKPGAISLNNISRKARAALRGQQGPPGPQGQLGATGAAGNFTTANVIQVIGPTASMCASGGGSCDVGASAAMCPAGARLLSGGWDGEHNPPVNATVAYNYPSADGSTWEVIMANSAPISASFHSVAICAKSSTLRVRTVKSTRTPYKTKLAREAGRVLQVLRR